MLEWKQCLAMAQLVSARDCRTYNHTFCKLGISRSLVRIRLARLFLLGILGLFLGVWNLKKKRRRRQGSNLRVQRTMDICYLQFSNPPQ